MRNCRLTVAPMVRSSNATADDVVNRWLDSPRRRGAWRRSQRSGTAVWAAIYSFLSKNILTTAEVAERQTR